MGVVTLSGGSGGGAQNRKKEGGLSLYRKEDQIQSGSNRGRRKKKRPSGLFRSEHGGVQGEAEEGKKGKKKTTTGHKKNTPAVRG